MERQGTGIGKERIQSLEVDEAVVRHLLRHTQYVGEPLLSILKRLLGLQEVPLTVDRAKPKARAEPPHIEETPFGPVEQLLVSANRVERDSGSVVRRFLKLLEAMYAVDGEAFCLHALNIRGRKRRYFGRSAQEIFQSGRRTNPLLIPNTPIWVVTNNSSDRKQRIVEQLAIRMGIPPKLQAQFATYLRRGMV